MLRDAVLFEELRGVVAEAGVQRVELAVFGGVGADFEDAICHGLCGGLGVGDASDGKQCGKRDNDDGGRK